LTPPERQELKNLEEDAQVAMRGFQKALGELANAFDTPQQAADKVAELKESEGLMQDLRDLGQGVVALQTIVGRDKYRVILITPDTIKQGEYPITRSELERKVGTFCAELRDPRSDPLPLAQELYKILIGPVAEELEDAQAQTLMWSLDGKLRYLPISALHDGEKYMVERYRSVIFTLASRPRLKDTPTLKWTALGLGVSPVSGFGALPAVREELGSIVRSGSGATQGVMTGDVLLDEAFTEQSLREALRKGHPLVHIASHFLLGDEGDSFLLLGDGSRLTLERIALIPNFFAGVELLTLSACDTALRERGADGQELESFGELVQRKGAKAVIASLWPVADESTSLLMQRFYGAPAMQPGIPKAEALRQAQVELLRGSGSAGGSKGIARFEHPLYWAPFVLIGNWR
jgi:CHAT domain-containing protein